MLRQINRHVPSTLTESPIRERERKTMFVLCSIFIHRRDHERIFYIPIESFIITWIGVRISSQTMLYTDCMLDIFVQEKNC
jgi:hypothetical protein